jgi:hypothetical protein
MHTRIGRDGIKRYFVALWLEEPAYAAHQKAAEEAEISLSEHVRRLLHRPEAVGMPLKIGAAEIPAPPPNVQRTLRKLAKLVEQQKTLIDVVFANPPFAPGVRYSVTPERRQTLHQQQTKNTSSARMKQRTIATLREQKAKQSPPATEPTPGTKPKFS